MELQRGTRAPCDDESLYTCGAPHALKIRRGGDTHPHLGQDIAGFFRTASNDRSNGAPLSASRTAKKATGKGPGTDGATWRYVLQTRQHGPRHGWRRHGQRSNNDLPRAVDRARAYAASNSLSPTAHHPVCCRCKDTSLGEAARRLPSRCAASEEPTPGEVNAPAAPRSLAHSVEGELAATLSGGRARVPG